MKRPAYEDLIEVAAYLRGEDIEDKTSLSRVSTWLFQYARKSETQKKAREAGTTVNYMRWLEDQKQE